MKCPYKYPHRSRKDIVEYLTEFGGHSERHGSYPIAFNVKVDVDLSFATIWELGGEWIKDILGDNINADDLHTFKLYCYLQHETLGTDLLWEWGVEDARRGITESDGYSMLWNGTVLDVVWEFHGRSGGWLVPTVIEGSNLEGLVGDCFEELLMEMGWKELCHFYKFIVQCEQDFGDNKPDREVEYQAAFNFFCNHIEHDWDSTQPDPELPVANWERGVLSIAKK